MPFAFVGTEALALAIPIIAILGGITLAAIAIVIEGRRKELRHRERLIAMEKGIELPQEPTERKRRPHYVRTQGAGFVVLFLGLALSFAMFVSGGIEAGVWGFPIAAIGLGLLVSSVLERRELGKKENKTPTSTQ